MKPANVSPNGTLRSACVNGTGGRLRAGAEALASSEKIRRELGWVPRKPELAAMIADAWEFAGRRVTAVA